MAQYEYTRIDHLQHRFRLLRLRAGSVVDSNLDCELIDARTNDNEIIPYEALSYTWGNELPVKAIRVGGRPMSIRANLHAALDDLRLPDRDRLLWIDAICIDQRNDAEKAHQVQQMADIYRKAERVVIWLGILDIGSFRFMESVARLERTSDDTKFTASNLAKLETAWKEIQQYLPPDRHGLAPTPLDGLMTILAHPWFRRGWIIQEVANARTATIHCSSHSVSSKLFALMPNLLQLEVDSHLCSILELMAGPSDRPDWWSEGRNLYTLLHKFPRAETTISRDKVFALLGICDDHEEREGGGRGLCADYMARESIIVERTLVAMYGCLYELFRHEEIAASTTSIEELCKNLAKIDGVIWDYLLGSPETHSLERFLRRTKAHTNLSRTALKAAEMQHGSRVADLLLQLQTPEAKNMPTVDTEQQQLLRTVASKTQHPHKLIEPLLRDLPAGTTISEEVFCAAAADEDSGVQSIDALLHFNTTLHCEITGNVLNTASRNTSSGPLILRKLLMAGMSGKIPERPKLTYDAGTICMAAIDPVLGPEMVRFLLERGEGRTEMSEVAFRAAAWNDRLCLEVILVVEGDWVKPGLPLRTQVLVPFLEDVNTNLDSRQVFQTLLTKSVSRLGFAQWRKCFAAAAKLSGNQEWIQLLENGPHRSYLWSLTDISLLCATELGFTSFAASFFDHSMPIKTIINDTCDRNGRSALSYAAGQGNMSFVQKLLDAGADIDHHDFAGRSPLCWAVLMNQRAIAGLLADSGARLLDEHCTCACGGWYCLKRRYCTGESCDLSRKTSPFRCSPYKQVNFFKDVSIH